MPHFNVLTSRRVRILAATTALIGLGTLPTVSAAAAPEQPTSVTARAYPNGIGITWDEPINNGGSPITGYDVTLNATAACGSLGPEARSCIVTGATSGSLNTLAVRTINADGASAYVNKSVIADAGTWGDTSTGSPWVADGSSPQIVMDEAGNIHAAWIANSGSGSNANKAMYAMRPAATSHNTSPAWGSAVTLSNTNAYNVDIAVRGSKIAVVWLRNNRIEASVKDGAAAWTAPTALTTNGNGDQDVDVIITEDGIPVAGWITWYYSKPFIIVERDDHVPLYARFVNNAWTTPAAVSGDPDVNNITLAAADGNRWFAAFQRSEPLAWGKNRWGTTLVEYDGATRKNRTNLDYNEGSVDNYNNQAPTILTHLSAIGTEPFVRVVWAAHDRLDDNAVAANRVVVAEAPYLANSWSARAVDTAAGNGAAYNISGVTLKNGGSAIAWINRPGSGDAVARVGLVPLSGDPTTFQASSAELGAAQSVAIGAETNTPLVITTQKKSNVVTHTRPILGNTIGEIHQISTTTKDNSSLRAVTLNNRVATTLITPDNRLNIREWLPKANPADTIINSVTPTLDRAMISWSADTVPQGPAFEAPYKFVANVLGTDQSCTQYASDTINYSCEVTGLDLYMNYQVRITTTSLSGATVTSPPKSFTTGTTVPAKITYLRLDRVNRTTLKASWHPPVADGGSPITGYTVMTSDGSSSCTAGADDMTCDLTVAAGKKYAIRVVAENAVGIGEQSDLSSEVFASDAPSTPDNITATSGFSSISVAWDAPTDTGGTPIKTYRVETVPASNGCTAVAPATTCTITGLNSNVTYTVRVVAINEADLETVSTSTASALSKTPPAAPSVVPSVSLARDTKTSMLAAWTAPTNDGGSPITGYKVVTQPGNLTCDEPITPTTTSCRISGLTPGQTYTLAVAATNANGDSEAVTSSPVKAYGLPSAPTQVRASYNPTTQLTEIEWDAPTDNGGSKITHYRLITDTGATCTVPAGTLLCGLTELVPNQQYTVVVYAHTEDDTISDASEPFQFIAQGASTNPTEPTTNPTPTPTPEPTDEPTVPTTQTPDTPTQSPTLETRTPGTQIGDPSESATTSINGIALNIKGKAKRGAAGIKWLVTMTTTNMSSTTMKVVSCMTRPAGWKHVIPKGKPKASTVCFELTLKPGQARKRTMHITAPTRIKARTVKGKLTVGTQTKTISIRAKNVR